MRCRFIAVMVTLLSLISSIGFAAIPRSELALGGVTLYTRFANVRQIYGEPTRTSYKDVKIWGGTSRFYTQYYGNGSFSATATNRDGILSVVTNANNGIATPAGIKVGMSARQLLMAYGAQDSKWADQDGNTVLDYHEKKKGVGTRDALEFTISDGKIVKIRLVAGILSI